MVLGETTVSSGQHQSPDGGGAADLHLWWTTTALRRADLTESLLSLWHSAVRVGGQTLKVRAEQMYVNIELWRLGGHFNRLSPPFCKRIKTSDYLPGVHLSLGGPQVVQLEEEKENMTDSMSCIWTIRKTKAEEHLQDHGVQDWAMISSVIRLL